MASNIAARRAAKATRRKAIVAEKRKVELQAGSLAGQVAQAASAPIRHCLLTDRWRETGMGTLILTRGVSSSHLTMGTFLLDMFALGIKDVVFRPIEADDLETILAVADLTAPLSPIDPGFGRKLMRDLAAWSTNLGYPPHRDYAVVERLFGTFSADTCTEVFQFGHQGNPLFISGPIDPLEQFVVAGADDGSDQVLEGSGVLLEG